MMRALKYAIMTSECNRGSCISPFTSKNHAKTTTRDSTPSLAPSLLTIKTLLPTLVVISDQEHSFFFFFFLNNPNPYPTSHLNASIKKKQFYWANKGKGGREGRTTEKGNEMNEGENEGEKAGLSPFVVVSLPASPRLPTRCQVASPPGSALGSAPQSQSPAARGWHLSL